ncbi:MAG: O-antigen ligase family protein, partial [Myxococcota bacterium]
KRSEQAHGVALVLFGALIPVGEGLAFGALTLLTLIVVGRWRELDKALFSRGIGAQVVRGLVVWFLAGVAALWLGGEGWLKPTELGRWLPLVAVPVVGVSVASLPVVWARRAALAFVGALVAASLFAVAQFALDVRPGEMLSRARADLPSQGRLPSNPDRSVAGGFYYHRLKMAHVLLVGLAPLVARQLFATLTPRRRAVELVLVALLGVTLALTFTRAALLAGAAAAAATTAFAPRRWRIAAGGLLVVAAVLLLSIAPVRERLISSTDRDASDTRAFIWSRAVQVMVDHPLGVGLGNYSTVVERYYGGVDAGRAPRTYPHNIVLGAWAEAGPLGLAGFLWAYAAPLVACAAELRRRRAGVRQVAAASGLFALVALGAVGLTHDVLFHNAVALAYASLLGLVVGCLDGEPCASP